MLRRAIAAATGWPPKRDAVQQHPALVVERLGDPVGDQHGAHRRVGRGDALGQRDQVGRRPVARGGEPLAEAPEAGDHLVGDERDPVLVGDLAQAGPVALGRHEGAAGVLDRLDDDHRHRLGAGLDDRALHLVEQLGAVGGRVVLELVAEARWCSTRDDRDRRGAERLLHRPHAGEARARRA